MACWTRWTACKPIATTRLALPEPLMSLKPPLSANDHTVGNAKAAIQVVE